MATAAVELTLEQEGQRLVVNEIGAALQSWTIGGRELLADGDFHGKMLAPWPGRLRDGRYRFEGAEHRTPLTEPERNNALHGLTTERRWRATLSSSRHLTLAHDLRPEPGYPFALALAVEYELVARGVAATLRATNVGDASAPFGAGLHPYLTHDGVAIDDLLLELPARTRLPLDDRLLPTGAPVPVAGTDADFRRAHAIGELRLDTCFGDLERDAAGVARVVLSTPQRDRSVTVWMDERFRFVQVYTAATGVAIEPMTCAPDAFNSGDGLLVLEPGESFTGRCGLAAATFPPTTRS
jgi:aldose 1-epimerase